MSSTASDARWRAGALAVLALTLAQLLVGTLASGLTQFQGKGFAGRLVAYPVLMLAVPAWSRLRHRDVPWRAVTLLMVPFLVDVSGNTLDLYDRVGWWDDANHLVNWFVLMCGVGLLLRPVVAQRRVLGWLVAGLGALLAIAWEVAEWYTFIRHGTELATAYEDTLGDQVLGTVGGALAGALLARRARPARPAG